ncbi:unnamed protein product [Periconia digitata]|uniref:Uncharacterized protein n=1 Tax=Periconia digitata TaxID=1303443 RepID=A0A9W4UJB3_9PLEO|nr:unnamed protein product [Periconia digitata]
MSPSTYRDNVPSRMRKIVYMITSTIPFTGRRIKQKIPCHQASKIFPASRRKQPSQAFTTTNGNRMHVRLAILPQQETYPSAFQNASAPIHINHRHHPTHIKTRICIHTCVCNAVRVRVCTDKQINAQRKNMQNVSIRNKREPNGIVRITGLRGMGRRT